jgi:hypothetical protein
MSTVLRAIVLYIEAIDYIEYRNFQARPGDFDLNTHIFITVNITRHHEYSPRSPFVSDF